MAQHGCGCAEAGSGLDAARAQLRALHAESGQRAGAAVGKHDAEPGADRRRMAAGGQQPGECAAMYEYKLERDDAQAERANIRTDAHILSTHMDYHPSRPWWMTLRLAGKRQTDRLRTGQQ